MSRAMVILADALIIMIAGTALAAVFAMFQIDSGLGLDAYGRIELYGFLVPLKLPRDGIIAALRRYRDQEQIKGKSKGTDPIDKSKGTDPIERGSSSVG